MAANLAVVIAAGVVVWLAVQRLSPLPAPDANVYVVGDKMDPVAGVDFHASPRTLLMALRRDCQFCQDSVPFYKNLSEAVQNGVDGGVRLVVVSTDPTVLLSAYLAKSGVRVDQVVATRPGALRIPGTPFLALINAAGIVENVWRGRLADSQERQVFLALGLAFPELP